MGSIQKTNLILQGSSLAELDKLPPLSFAPDALEPYIDTMTMQIHHDKHHQTYIAKLQTALSQAPMLKGKSLVISLVFCFDQGHRQDAYSVIAARFVA